MARTPGSIPIGTIPGWPGEFETSGRLSFARSVGEDAARWWNAKIFDKVKLFPDGFAERLSLGLPGEHSYHYELIDPYSQSIRLEMTGSSSVRVPLWVHGQEIILQKETIFESAVLVGERQQGRGLGKQIASNVFNMARDLDLSQITLDAWMTGKYFWARLGFLPDRGSWEFKLRTGIKSKLVSLGRAVDDRRRAQVLRLLDSPEPETIRAIANLRDLVPSDIYKTEDGRRMMIPLGMALLAEADAPWYGVLDLRDLGSVKVFEAGVGRGR